MKFEHLKLPGRRSHSSLPATCGCRLFLAFQCQAFGYDDTPTGPDDKPTKSYLTEALDVECTFFTGRHQPIIAMTVPFIVMWPVAMPLMYAFLLYRCHQAVLNHQPTALSRAIRFLWSEYEDKYYWWELVELVKKLVLTNVLLFIDLESGSTKFLRLITGLLIAFLGITLQLIAQPYHRLTDDAFNVVVQLMLVIFFIAGILIKLCDPEETPALGAVSPTAEETCYALVGLPSAYTASVIMIGTGIVVLAVPLLMLIQQLVAAQSMPILHDSVTMQPPVLFLEEGETYHLFLSQ